MGKHDVIIKSTGEFIPREDALVVPNSVPLHELHVRIYEFGFDALMHADLSSRDHQVLWAMVKRMTWENYITPRANEIADELGMNRAHVTRSISKLVKAGVFVRTGRRDGPWPELRMDINFGYKGKDYKRRMELAASDRARGDAHRDRLRSDVQLQE